MVGMKHYFPTNISVYNFLTNHYIVNPIQIISKSTDSIALAKLHSVFNEFGLTKNQILVDKINIGE